jgi:hypothetical protein
MGDKAILTEVLEASRLTDTYSNLTVSNIIDQFVTGKLPCLRKLPHLIKVQG